MNLTIAVTVLCAVAMALAFVGVVTANVAVMVAGLPCAVAVIGIVAWEEWWEGRA